MDPNSEFHQNSTFPQQLVYPLACTMAYRLLFGLHYGLQILRLRIPSECRRGGGDEMVALVAGYTKDCLPGRLIKVVAFPVVSCRVVAYTHIGRILENKPLLFAVR